ncbi:putative non-specific serine/threonine protein kinase [Helianthus annuus]|nr:putative non-specific serine/threonine protein kinase [Helianthus annuus]KAJ0736598.1 putative non-specific serine/threonine protein kinase [Helianthus annuus]KAJ0739543.1 putative non-specific serine/threonine protein kinase [Helianthus annuus]
MDEVNESDENDKISNLLDPDAKNKPLNESRKTSQTSRTKMAFYSKEHIYRFSSVFMFISPTGATADWWSVGQIFTNILNKDIPWPQIPDDMSEEAYDLIDKLLTDNPLQRLGATGAGEVKKHHFFKNINWDTLARQKATFIPAAEALDTSYFMSRYIWNPEDEHIDGGSDFDDMSGSDYTSCGGSFNSNMSDEEDDECNNLADFDAPPLNANYSFSNFSFKVRCML